MREQAGWLLNSRKPQLCVRAAGHASRLIRLRTALVRAGGRCKIPASMIVHDPCHGFSKHLADGGRARPCRLSAIPWTLLLEQMVCQGLIAGLFSWIGFLYAARILGLVTSSFMPAVTPAGGAHHDVDPPRKSDDASVGTHRFRNVRGGSAHSQLTCQDRGLRSDLLRGAERFSLGVGADRGLGRRSRDGDPMQKAVSHVASTAARKDSRPQISSTSALL
jgi:hypothetical protein